MANSAERNTGLQTALDISIAPKTVFTKLRDAPVWRWAFVLSAVVAMLATFLMSPALVHALGVELPARLATTPQIAQLPAAQRDPLIAQQVTLAQTFVRFSFIAVPFGLAAGCALQALIMLIANAIGKGDGTFKKFWAVAVHAAVVGTGISSIALLAIVLIRGADSFTSSREFASTLPGLGLLVPAGAKAAGAFFGVMNVFTLWHMVLLALGMVIVARLSRATAIATAIVMLLGAGLIPLVGALIQK